MTRKYATGLSETQKARLQKIPRLVSIVRSRTSACGATRSRRISHRRAMVRSPRQTRMAKIAYAIDQGMLHWKRIREVAKVDAPTKRAKIQKMIMAGSTHSYTVWGLGPRERQR